MNSLPLWKVVFVGSYGLLIGIALGRTSTVLTFLYVFLLSTVLALISHRHKVRVALIWVFCFMTLCGMWRAYQYIDAIQPLVRHIGGRAVVSGTLRDDPSITQRGNTTFVLDSLSVDGVKITGRLLAQTSTIQTIRRSDRVTIEGNVSEGFGGYSASIFDGELLEVNKLSEYDRGLQIRDWFSRSIRSTLPETHASLGLGFLVGEKSSLPEELVLDLRLTGLTHIVVASGFNLTIIVIFVRKLFHRVSRYTATVIGFSTIFGFLLISGLSPSMLRASLVTGLSLLAWYFGRKFMPLLLLGLVAAITATYNPYYVWGDVGWYLSFLAFFGVLVLAPLLSKYYFGDKQKTNVFRSAFIESISAIIMTAPYMLYVFGQFSTVALLANVIVVPMIPFAMVATFFAGILTGLAPVIGTLVAFPARIILDVILWVIETIARRDPGIETEQFPLWAVLGLYSLVALFTLYIHRKNRVAYFEDENLLDDIDRQSQY